MPEKLIGELRNHIQVQWKRCFWAAVIIGLLTHIYKITNWLPNWDSLVFRYDAQNMVALGRWFLPVASAPSSYYDLPWVTGVLSIIFHGLGAVCICKIFHVANPITAVLIGASVVSFPTVTSVLLYNYVADSYAFAFLLSCIAALLITDKKPKYVLAAVIIALSAGIYQAYITVTIMLLLGYLIIEILYKDIKIHTLLRTSVKYLFTGLCGMVLYYAVFILILKVTEIEILDYQGFSSTLSLSNLDILGSIYSIKKNFVQYFFDVSNGINVFIVINGIILLAACVFYLHDIINNKCGVPKVLILAVCVILLPVGASALSFLNSSIDYHNLMKMGYFLFYLLFILQYEKRTSVSAKYDVLKSWFILGVTLVLIFNQIIIANVSYHKLTLAYEKSYGTLIRIADRMEQIEGAQDCERILVLGALENSEAYSSNFPPNMTGTTDGYILRKDDESVGQSVLCSALNDYCGKDYKFVRGKEKTRLLQEIDMDDLDNWPAKQSIAVINDVVVIKLSD